MGNPTAFLEIFRETPAKRSPENRITDFAEFIDRYTEKKLNEQSARCMDCGVPFCHHGCPLGNIIPEFNDAVYRQNWKEAYDILSSTNNFPEFTGRICPAPCESSCVLGINSSPVAIEEIEKHIIEIAFENGYVQPKQINYRTGKRVAVVGSGPAGLAAAAQLNYAGHSVTVFERDDKPGGLLRYGIPDFKLEKWVVDRRIDILKEEGIEFRCNTNIGIDISFEELMAGFDAVILAGGSTIPRDLEIPGREFKGIHFAMDLLKQQNKKVSQLQYDNERIDIKGKHVIVIGGGDTGSDCIGTCNRLGAASITQLELLPKPPISRNEYMPWPTYPMVLKTTSSHEEGADRIWAVLTKEFLGDEEKRLKGIKLCDLEWRSDGKFVEIPGSEREVECDIVLLAMGFLHPEHDGVVQQSRVDLDNRGNVRSESGRYSTSIQGVFSAGDMRRGQSLVVWAIFEGRECASEVDGFLGLI